MNELNEIFHKASEEMYKNTSTTSQEQQKSSDNTSQQKNDAEVTDADFEEVK
jgi:hypothetical protein